MDIIPTPLGALNNPLCPAAVLDPSSHRKGIIKHSALVHMLPSSSSSGNGPSPQHLEESPFFSNTTALGLELCEILSLAPERVSELGGHLQTNHQEKERERERADVPHSSNSGGGWEGANPDQGRQTLGQGEDGRRHDCQISPPNRPAPHISLPTAISYTSQHLSYITTNGHHISLIISYYLSRLLYVCVTE